jgi:hypothetical protein
MISLASFESVPVWQVEANKEAARREHADYCGWQEGASVGEGFHLWTLLQGIPGHPAGSTIVQDTLDEAIASGAFNVTK